MTASTDQPSSPQQEVDQLRDRVEALSSHTSPAVAKVADQAKGYARQAQDYAAQAQAAIGDQTEWLSQHTRASPITTLLLASVAGYLIGRIVR